MLCEMMSLGAVTGGPNRAYLASRTGATQHRAREHVCDRERVVTEGNGEEGRAREA
jgi:hypothetical protein